MASKEEQLQQLQKQQQGWQQSPMANAQIMLPASLALQPSTLKSPIKGPEVCKQCTRPVALCPCPKGGGSGGGNEESSDAGRSKDTDLMEIDGDVPTPDPGSSLEKVVDEHTDLTDALALKPELTPEELEEHFEFILDETTGGLSIAPRPGSTLSPEQVDNYFKALDQHFQAFQQELAAKNGGQPIEGFSREVKGNTITYKIPAEHYETYLNSLVEKGFAPARILNSLNQAMLNQATRNQDSLFAKPNLTLFAPSPFRTTPMPGSGGTPSKENKEDSDNTKSFATAPAA